LPRTQTRQRRGGGDWRAVALLCGLSSGIQAADVPVLRILQRTEGVGESLDPDAKARPVLQRLTVDQTGKLISLEWLDSNLKVGEGERVTRQVILRMDGSVPTLWELDPARKTYREQAGDLNRYQLDRRIAEDAIIQNARTRQTQERDRLLQENYLKADGSRDVELKRSPGRTLLGRACERIEITENGRRIIDAQVSRDVPGATSYFHLYRRLGAFSAEVLAKMEAIEGVPLIAKITVVTALPARELEVEVLDVKGATLPTGFFRPPTNFERESLVPKNARCAYCGGPIQNPEAPPAQARTKTGFVLFDSEEHYEAYLDAKDAGKPVPADTRKEAPPSEPAKRPDPRRRNNQP
jgi:hypothetical protein